MKCKFAPVKKATFVQIPCEIPGQSQAGKRKVIFFFSLKDKMETSERNTHCGNKELLAICVLFTFPVSKGHGGETPQQNYFQPVINVFISLQLTDFHNHIRTVSQIVPSQGPARPRLKVSYHTMERSVCR